MATLPESIDYTDKDFDALRARLIALIKCHFPDWTDFDVASFGNLLVELYAYVGDVPTFYQDNLARESPLVTATQRKSVMALAKMLGYRIQILRGEGVVASVRDVRRRVDGDVIVWGSLTLADALLQAGEVDVLRLRIVPVLIG